jgi:hypothetical protein
MKSLSICLFAAAIPAIADIDSGGGGTAVGAMTNHASIELSFATGNSAAGSNENKSELILMLFTENPATGPNGEPIGGCGRRRY